MPISKDTCSCALSVRLHVLSYHSPDVRVCPGRPEPTQARGFPCSGRVSLCAAAIFHSGDHKSTWRGRSTTVRYQVPSGQRELSVRGHHRGSSLELYLRAMRRMPPPAVCLHRRATVYCRASSWPCIARQPFKTAIHQLDRKRRVTSAGK